MKGMFDPRILLLGILVIAGVLRTVGIGSNPPAISWDEASIGYNAFTILTEFRDEHGKFLPLDTFAAFGDYKPPLPIYLTVPFVALFGLTETAVRMPSAIAGIFTVWLLYLICLELFRKSPYAMPIGLTAASVLSVTPWHIMLSRAGFEANIAVMFLCLGVLFVLRAQRDPRYFYVCWVPFVAGMYTFNSARYAGPLLAAPLFFASLRSAKIHMPQFARGIVIALVLLLPIIPHLMSRQSRLRFEEVSIFTDLRTVLTSNARRGADGYAWWSGILHNRRIGYAREYLIHFFDNLEPRFTFMTGDGNPKFSIQDTGQLLLVSAPFLVYGLLALIRDYPYVAMLLGWWVFVSVAPTAVARETPHALRIENALPAYIIATAYGLVLSVVSLKRSLLRTLFIFLVGSLIAGNVLYFLHNFANHYPKEFSGEWQYGYKQVIEKVRPIKHSYDTIVLTESIGRPYIYALFYERVSLREFEATKDASFDAAGFYNVYGFGKYRFTREGIGEYAGRTLYILPPKDVPENARILDTIRLLNGTPVLVMFE